jgi:HSP20 family molecular chaperone IbpA
MHNAENETDAPDTDSEEIVESSDDTVPEEIVEPSDEIVEQKSEVVEQAGESEDIWYRIRPSFSSHVDYSTGEYISEIQLPGVPKDRVKLRILPELFDLKASWEHVLYTLMEYFPVKVNMDTFEAQYNHGLLRMKAQFLDPLAEAVDIVLQD